MMGNIMVNNKHLQKANLTLVEWVEQLSANITSQGGADLGWHTFTSETAVQNLAMEECPSGDAFSAFVDPMTLFCHDAMFFPVFGW